MILLTSSLQAESVTALFYHVDFEFCRTCHVKYDLHIGWIRFFPKWNRKAGESSKWKNNRPLHHRSREGPLDPRVGSGGSSRFKCSCGGKFILTSLVQIQLVFTFNLHQTFSSINWNWNQPMSFPSCFDDHSSAPMSTKTSMTKGSHRIRRRDAWPSVWLLTAAGGQKKTSTLGIVAVEPW